MKLNELIKTKIRSKKRVGRGIGSGLGKTAGRGTKGQKARGKIPASFTGSGLPTFKKLPLRRGLGNRNSATKPQVINLSKLNSLKKNTIVDLEQLINLNLISKKDSKRGVKILYDGQLKQSLIIKLPVSKKVKAEIESKGGKVENV